MFNGGRGKQEKMGRKQGKANQGGKEGHGNGKGTQAVLFGGKVITEKRSQDVLLETFGSQQIKFLYYLLGGVHK